LLFFALSLVGFNAYMGAKAPNSRTAEDGTHPFYLWKISMFVYSFWMQAGLHLVILMSLNTSDTYSENQTMETILHIVPFGLLLIDWTVNRLYLTLSVVIWYPLLAYFMIGAYINIIQVEMTNLPTIKEFEVFDVEP